MYSIYNLFLNIFVHGQWEADNIGNDGAISGELSSNHCASVGFTAMAT